MANMYCRMTRDKNLILRPIEYHYHTMMMIRNEVGETNTFSIQKKLCIDIVCVCLCVCVWEVSCCRCCCCCWLCYIFFLLLRYCYCLSRIYQKKRMLLTAATSAATSGDAIQQNHLENFYSIHHVSHFFIYIVNTQFDCKRSRTKNTKQKILFFNVPTKHNNKWFARTNIILKQTHTHTHTH